MPGLQFVPCLDRLSLAFLRRVMHLGKATFIEFVKISKLPTQKRQSNTNFLSFAPVLEISSQIICASTTAEETQHILLNENRTANVVNHHEDLH